MPSGSSKSWLTIGDAARMRPKTAPHVADSSIHTADSCSGPATVKTVPDVNIIIKKKRFRWHNVKKIARTPYNNNNNAISSVQKKKHKVTKNHIRA